MPFSRATGGLDTGRFTLGLILGLALTLGVAGLWGAALIEAQLPITRGLLNLFDDHFRILVLDVERNWQDTVVRLRVVVDQPFVIGGQVIGTDSGWFEVTTTTGAMLQPLVIAPALALALPGGLLARILAGGIAALLALGFLLLDVPLTLYGYLWDMFIDSMEPDRFSPVMVWHGFLHAGGRLGIALILGVAGWRLARRGQR